MRRWLPGFATSLTVLGTAAALLMLMLFVGVVTLRGLGHFWPAPVLLVDDPAAGPLYGVHLRQFDDGTRLLRLSSARAPAGGTPLIRIPANAARGASKPADVGVFRTAENGVLYGRLVGVIDRDTPSLVPLDPWSELELRTERSLRLQREIRDLERDRLARINRELRAVERRLAALEGGGEAPTGERLALRTDRRALLDAFEDASARLALLRQRAADELLAIEAADGTVVEVPVADLLAASRPNQLGPLGRVRAFLTAVGRFLGEGPRQAGDPGGIFPALFGTVLLVLLMAVLVAPLGVLVAVYLVEYARQNWITRLIRSAIGNLAAVPSIVYGVFGLAFFVYTVGGSIDRLLFADSLPAPTFGTGGLLWAALTLALLTLPVVIVASEEALARVPRSLREASSALGATRLETIRHSVLPMAMPGVLTGLILAIARAAGEVAPLMLVGVVKLAQTLPVDADFPFLHLDRKFMHLGFHIYDLALQSPSLALGESAVYATALLLLVIIVLLNLVAATIRNRLREELRKLEAPL